MFFLVKINLLAELWTPSLVFPIRRRVWGGRKTKFHSSELPIPSHCLPANGDHFTRGQIVLIGRGTSPSTPSLKGYQYLGRDANIQQASPPTISQFCADKGFESSWVALEPTQNNLTISPGINILKQAHSHWSSQPGFDLTTFLAMPRPQF